MQLISKLATAAAVATVAVGAGATAASAYSISGGAYTGASTVGPTFTFGGAYTHTCSAMSMSGSATGSDTTTFTPSFSGCTFLGLSVPVSQSGAVSLKVTGDDGFGTYYGELAVPAGVTTTLSNPVMGCTIVIAGPQTLGGIEMLNTGTGVELSATVSGFAYTTSSCGFGSASNGVLRTNGPVVIPGITVS